jgi:hypothetical protein
MTTQTTQTDAVAKSRLVAELGRIDAVDHAETFADGAVADISGHFDAMDEARIAALGYRIDGVSHGTGRVWFGRDS